MISYILGTKCADYIEIECTDLINQTHSSQFWSGKLAHVLDLLSG